MSQSQKSETVGKAQKADVERQVSGVQEQVSRLQQKRRLYSWQHAEGIITEEGLLAAHRQIRSEESISNAQLRRPEELRGEPAPPDWSTFKNLAEYRAGVIAFELDQASDDVKVRFAELFDLRVTIHPDSSRDGYHFDLSANIPLEMEGAKPGAYEMVFSPPRKG